MWMKGGGLSIRKRASGTISSPWIATCQTAGPQDGLCRTLSPQQRTSVRCMRTGRDWSARPLYSARSGGRSRSHRFVRASDRPHSLRPRLDLQTDQEARTMRRASLLTFLWLIGSHATLASVRSYITRKNIPTVINNLSYKNPQLPIILVEWSRNLSG